MSILAIKYKIVARDNKARWSKAEQVQSVVELYEELLEHLNSGDSHFIIDFWESNKKNKKIELFRGSSFKKLVKRIRRAEESNENLDIYKNDLDNLVSQVKKFQQSYSRSF